jgi:8-oxo-dGTP diphosphatase
VAAEREGQQVFRDTYVLVRQRDLVLLVLRGKHIYRGGQWGLPSGQVYPTETYLATATRKLRDEVGLETLDSLRFMHLLERVTSNGDHWVATFFSVDVDPFNPVNNEPHKHDAVAWFHIDELPDNVGDYIRHAISAIRKGETFSEFREP